MKIKPYIKVILIVFSIFLFFLIFFAIMVFNFINGVSESTYNKIFKKVEPMEYTIYDQSYRPGNCYDTCSKYEVYMNIPQEYDYSKLYDQYTEILVKEGYSIKTSKEKFITPPREYIPKENERIYPSYLRIYADKGSVHIAIIFEYKFDSAKQSSITPPVDEVLYEIEKK